MLIRLSPKVRRKWQHNKSLIILLIITSFLIATKFIHQSLQKQPRPENPPYSDQDFYSDTDGPFFRGCTDVIDYLNDPSYVKMDATFIMLTKNEELNDVLKTIESIETHFNQWFKYPYVFLNNVPFTEDFQFAIMSMTDADVQFGTIDEIDWEFPEEVRDSPLFKSTMDDQSDRGVMYGSMESYHKMCRFYSGLFYKHPLMRKHKWYWRLEPDVEFFCDITYDPFFEMAKSGKKYGFTVLIPEMYWTVPNLFRFTKSFVKDLNLKVGTLWQLFVRNYHITDTHDDDELSRWSNNAADLEYEISANIAIDYTLNEDPNNEEGIQHLVAKAKSKIPLVEDKFDDQEYNLCHFWSNFEIARLDVFDNEIYNAYFQYLEEAGGFWAERWGDAPVHSLGLALTLNLEDIHYFRDVGYRHSILHHCPRNFELLDVTEPEYRAMQPKYERKGMKYDKGFSDGIGCRCDCPKNKIDVEDTSYPCMDVWLELLYNEDNSKNFRDGEFVPHFDSKEMREGIEKDFRERQAQ
ncbi:hypothetical protein NCAS_0B06170 [Naumovozyma castellii]|uniref:Mannosyltransferase n=1 Tax=Naumovozyma castellii TaxID=27288 RepID=G0V9T4_NAUCA|nr:hypothetical protein NCAS_0B06170 [Naumovozyma castellii CBS 4309]CCC68701.1 hypothetical protein NCAS_0B06170 [Naumovozyma castellii CBS 4309]